MEFELDEKAISEALNKVGASAIENALSSHNVKSVIEERVADTLIAGTLAEALEKAVEQMNMKELTTALANQLARTVTATAVSMIREQTVELLFTLKGGQSYDSDKDKKKEEIRQSIKHAEMETE